MNFSVRPQILRERKIMEKNTEEGCSSETGALRHYHSDSDVDMINQRLDVTL